FEGEVVGGIDLDDPVGFLGLCGLAEGELAVVVIRLDARDGAGDVRFVGATGGGQHREGSDGRSQHRSRTEEVGASHASSLAKLEVRHIGVGYRTALRSTTDAIAVQFTVPG